MRSAGPTTLLLLAALLTTLLAGPDVSRADGWAPFADEDVIEIVTTDEDGDPRETKVWIVVLDGSGWVRTNDSRWLANIRRGSPVALRIEEWESSVSAREVTDRETRDRVEEAFKAKYGLMQRIMSTFRFSEPTVLRLTLAHDTESARPASPWAAPPALATRVGPTDDARSRARKRIGPARPMPSRPAMARSFALPAAPVSPGA